MGVNPTRCPPRESRYRVSAAPRRSHPRRRRINPDRTDQHGMRNHRRRPRRAFRQSADAVVHYQRNGSGAEHVPRPRHRISPTTARCCCRPAISATPRTPSPNDRRSPRRTTPGASKPVRQCGRHPRDIGHRRVFRALSRHRVPLHQAVATADTVVSGATAQPLAVGTDGTMLKGTAPDGSKAVTLVLFTQGRAWRACSSPAHRATSPPNGSSPISPRCSRSRYEWVF